MSPSRTRALGSTCLALVALASGSGCSVQSNAILPSADGGPEGDGAVTDGWLPDVLIPADAGPPCTSFGETRVLRVVEGGALTVAGAILTRVEREAPAQIALRAQRYRYGVIEARGFEDALLADPPVLAALSDAIPLARAFRDGLDETDGDGSEPLYGLALSADGVYTVEVRGELRLPAGDDVLYLDVDDRGVLELDLDGTLVVLQQAGPGESSIAFAAPRDGFYPFHAAVQNAGGPGRFRVELDTPTTGRRAIETSELRATGTNGREVWGWDARDVDDDPLATLIDVQPTVIESTTASYPGLGLGATNWTARFIGRYPFSLSRAQARAESNDAHRIFIDGVFLGGRYNQNSPAYVVDERTASQRGVLDVLYEFENGAASASTRFEVDGRPLDGEDALPIARFGGRPHAQGVELADMIDDGADQSASFVLSVPGDSPSAVDVSTIIVAENPAGVTVRIEAPSGESASWPLTDAMFTTTRNEWHLRRVPDWSSSLTSADGTWEMTIENRSGHAITWQRFGVVAHLGGTPDAYERTGEYVTPFIDFGDEVEVSGVRLGGNAEPGTSLVTSIRSGPSPALVDAMPFVDTDGRGDLPLAQRGRFAQVRVALAGPGWATPRVEDVRMVGRACRRCAMVDPMTCPEERTSEGLVVLYPFDDGGGSRRARDLSGFGPPVDLLIDDPARVRWQDTFLEVLSDTILIGDRPLDVLNEAMRAASGMTLEAWVTPARPDQAGPARILTIAPDPFSLDVLLGQANGTWEGRVRHAAQLDGRPYIDSALGSTPAALTHVVLVRREDGTGQLYVDGSPSGAGVDASGDFASWDASYRIAVANESSRDRAWNGELHLIALYARALTDEEIARHFRLGP